MKIIPAIDLLNQEAVRLYKGDYAQKTVYSKTPWELVTAFHETGAELIHVVDLNGARSGSDTTNKECITKIRKATNAKIQLGGGIRNMEKLKYYDAMGIDRFIVGTAAVRNPQFVDAALQEMGADRVIIGVDARDGYVRVSGWEEDTKLPYEDLLDQLEKQGVTQIIFTDISLDGTLSGPNLDSYRKILDRYSFQLIASGGIASMKDIFSLLNIGAKHPMYGVITGKAIYEGRLDLKEAFTDVKKTKVQ
ncbi:MAG: 1-(5-phosphoribosyl)-5-[(5-phosphoribosylamino)methylideneamino]imidazole-4-carboxamide isomerase [Spirochaetota bacterium]